MSTVNEVRTHLFPKLKKTNGIIEEGSGNNGMMTVYERKKIP
jgi:hypothetical protein